MAILSFQTITGSVMNNVTGKPVPFEVKLVSNQKEAQELAGGHGKSEKQTTALNLYLTLSPPEGPYGSTVFIENYEFSGGKAFGILIDLKGYAHCIYLFLTESLIMIPPGKQQST